MVWRTSHCADIADVRRDGFVADGIRRIQVTDEMTVLGEQVRAEHQRMTGRNIKDGGVVSNWNRHRRLESFADFSDEAAFAEILELHTVASAFFRRRRGPRRGAVLRGFLFSSSAALKTLLTSSTRMNFISFRIVSFTSSRSRLFNDGRITVSILARRAASTFSLMPPTGRTSPRSVISPVIAIFRWTAFPVSNERMAVAMVTPAEGPSFGIAPSGAWTWMSCFEKKSSLIPNSFACERA